LEEAYRDAITLMHDFRDAQEGSLPIVVSGCIG
jgi:hypothetical protein